MNVYPLEENSVSPVKWDDAFSTGIQTIDEQHKRLVGIIKTLYDAIADGEVSSSMDVIFHDLFEYCEQHFSYEEGLFDEYDYPDSEDHKTEHVGLRRQLIILKNNIYDGQHFMSEVLLLKFLEEWLINHIMKTDKKFGLYLIGKGVK